MRLSAIHTTTYCYGEAVHLEPHVVRLRPRSDGAQKLWRYELSVDPEPAGRADCLDQDGNVVTQLWFASPAARLCLESRFEVEPLRENPFDFLLPADRVLTVPFAYGDPWNALLAPYIDHSAVSGIVTAFAEEIARECGGRTVRFLAALNQRLFDGWRHTIRPHGDPHPAETTLEVREGSCRDMAVLFCDACRALGLASRFVSGYERAAAGHDHPYMHAWAEVYLPGGGWRGFDPSRGLAVSKDHVAVAAARFPALATPVSGTYLGGTAAHLDVQISMQVSESS